MWRGWTTRRGMDRARKAKRRRSGCAQRANPLLSIAATVAPQSCDSVRGALVLRTPARPARSLCSTRRPASGRLLPIVVRFVLPYFTQVGLRPEADLNAAQSLNCGSLNLLGLNPAVEGAPTNTYDSGNLHRGVGRLWQYGIPYPMLSSKKTLDRNRVGDPHRPGKSTANGAKVPKFYGDCAISVLLGVGTDFRPGSLQEFGERNTVENERAGWQRLIFPGLVTH